MADLIGTEEQEMKDEIDFYRKQGYANGQIATILKNKGYDDGVVDDFFAKPRPEFAGTAIKPGKRKLDVKGMFMYLLVVLLVVAVILIIWNVFFGGSGLGEYMQVALGI